MKKLDIATKRVVVYILKLLVFWGVFIPIDLLVVDRYFDTSTFDAIVSQPRYYYGAIGVAFTLFTTMLEAHFYYMKESLLTDELRKEYKSKTGEINEHFIFMSYRICFLIPAFINTDILTVVCYFCAFPFFHDGFYYRFRDLIVPGTYPKRWFAQSSTSGAFSTKYFPLIVRVPLAIVAIVCLILIQIYNG